VSEPVLSTSSDRPVLTPLPLPHYFYFYPRRGLRKEGQGRYFHSLQLIVSFKVPLLSLDEVQSRRALLKRVLPVPPDGGVQQDHPH